MGCLKVGFAVWEEFWWELGMWSPVESQMSSEKGLSLQSQPLSNPHAGTGI